MTNLERKFEKLVEKLRTRYVFLKDVSIDIVEGYGCATGYRPKENAIYIDLKGLKQKHNTPRFIQRLGRHNTFDAFVLVVLLHEIRHVLQQQTLGVDAIISSINVAGYGTEKGHDKCKLEKEADKWADSEFPKVKNLLK